MSLSQELDHLRISFDHIKFATNNFSNQHFIGQGGFGRVYKGQLPSSTGSSEPELITVAVKRLDVKGGQGKHEFLNELVMLASYKHDNLVSLVGFCDDGNEKVLVYKHEVNGSLDKHIPSTTLTWEQRLKICLGAAQGLEYLHDGVGIGHRVLHRDVKSSNILLDANWNAKISDFGLSKIGPTNQQFTFLFTSACGTLGYVDPLYHRTGVLTKESDVFSFGVVLFEVLSGRLATITKYDDHRRFLFGLVKFHQENGTLHEIIMPNLLDQMEPRSLQVFSNIAFKCLNEDRKLRPTMDLVVRSLETALKHQLVAPTIFSESQFVNGSLDNHLSSTTLTWEQRLKICLGVAQGLDYLHGGVEAEHLVLHGDIKSSNIFLDVNWKPRISDSVLSSTGPIDQQITFPITNPQRTSGYLDPLYVRTGVPTRESDIYSFGVVLFEVMCGRLAMITENEDKRIYLTDLVKLHKEKGTLHEIIMPNLLEQMKPYTLQVFSDIAFECIKEDRKYRPTTGLLLKSLEAAIHYQLATRPTVSESEFGRRTKLRGSKTGGWPFLFQLGSNQKLRKMTIYHFGWINSLIFTVEDSNGLLYSPEQYGGLHDRQDFSNEKKFVMDFDADEEITGISGTVGRPYTYMLVTSLSFVTNKKIYGPFGDPRNTDDHFSESWDLGLFDGFYGRCGWYVDALGCCLKNIV